MQTQITNLLQNGAMTFNQLHNRIKGDKTTLEKWLKHMESSGLIEIGKQIKLIEGLQAYRGYIAPDLKNTNAGYLNNIKDTI